ncbi:hypothetical protein Q3G72_006123 [Acer saccharum]|nr:hypothetical protein Q3G72_006123 [Acer saccharum]
MHELKDGQAVAADQRGMPKRRRVAAVSFDRRPPWPWSHGGLRSSQAEIQPNTRLHRGEGLRSKVRCQNVPGFGNKRALTGTHFGQQSLNIQH